MNRRCEDANGKREGTSARLQQQQGNALERYKDAALSRALCQALMDNPPVYRAFLPWERFRCEGELLTSEGICEGPTAFYHDTL
jgi:hypothetical protein